MVLSSSVVNEKKVKFKKKMKIKGKLLKNPRKSKLGNAVGTDAIIISNKGEMLLNFV